MITAAGKRGWGVDVTAGRVGVQVSVTGPEGGWYSGDWMSPEQAEALGVSLIQRAAEARAKAAQHKPARFEPVG